MGMWHRLLLFLRLRNAFDWAPPGLGPEMNHPYMPHASLRCCEHCGGGKLNAIHREPYNPRRLAEILGQRWDGGPGIPMPNPYLDGEGSDDAFRQKLERER